MIRPLTLTNTPDRTEDTSPSLVEAAYDALREAVRGNVFPPGHRATEADIARQLGMSRTPVHEAIIRLQAEGLVEVLSRRGVLICPISADDIREIYDVLIAVEGMASALMAQLPEDQRLPATAQLDGYSDAMDAAVQAGDLIAWAAADDLFHQALTALCGNGRLARVSATVRDQSHRARIYTLHLRSTPHHSSTDHRAIAAAIRAADPQAAERAARDHRISARDTLVPLIRHYGMKNL